MVAISGIVIVSVDVVDHQMTGTMTHYKAS
jgi:hypothetical protein